MVRPVSRIGRSGVFTLLLVATVVFVGCDLGEDTSGGSTTPSVESVENVTLTETSSTDDFGTLSSGYSLPVDKDEALFLMGIGLEEVGDYLGTQLETWEPTGESTFNLTPEELMNGFPEPPPSQITLEAALRDEVIGVLGAYADAEADVRISYNSDDLPTRITGTASGTLHVDMGEIDTDTTDDTRMTGGSFHAALSINVDVALNDWRTVTDDDGYEDVPSSVDAAFAVSLRVSSAMSVEGNLADDFEADNLVQGNLLVTGGFDTNQTLEITQAMIDDNDQLMAYLEEVMEEPEFSLEITVYDADRSLQDTYTYDLAYFTDTTTS
ncbi:MAG: hypothetical protein WD492_16030 [Alkalispirochaeta sp.]